LVIIMELLTVDETARLLKVAPVTVRRYIADGRLPAVRVGRGVRVRKETVGQFVTPIKPRKSTKRGTRKAWGRPTGADDPLWSIIGMVTSEGPGDVSRNKHRYLAEAYADLHQ
jgi:excisionase family DNA binding protein